MSIMNIIPVFWILDIFNFPFMEMFDTEYPLNTEFWLFIFVFTNAMN